MILQITSDRFFARAFIGCPKEDLDVIIGRIWLYRLGPGADHPSSSCDLLSEVRWRPSLDQPAPWEKMDTL